MVSLRIMSTSFVVTLKKPFTSVIVTGVTKFVEPRLQVAETLAPIGGGERPAGKRFPVLVQCNRPETLILGTTILMLAVAEAMKAKRIARQRKTTKKE